MVKKITAALCMLLMLLCFSACGRKEAENVECKVTFSDGEVYEGTYTGEWNKKLPDGKGTFKYTSLITGGERVMTGTFSAGHLVDGYIKLSGNNPDGKSFTYDGEYSNGKYNGKGRYEEKRSDGKSFTYDGEISNGKWDGNGHLEIKYSDGKVVTYDGEYSNGKYHGQGKFTSTSSDGESLSYDGGFKLGVCDGEGRLIIKYTNGDIKTVTGIFADDKPNGQGRIRYQDAEMTSTIEGELVDGKFYGEARYRLEYADGRVDTGTYIDGKYKSDSTGKIIKIGDGIAGFVGGKVENIWGLAKDILDLD